MLAAASFTLSHTGGTSKARSAANRKKNDRPLGTERPAPSGDDMPQAKARAKLAAVKL